MTDKILQNQINMVGAGQVYRFFILIYLYWACYDIYAQEKENPKDVFLEAESYFLYEEFNEALPLYQRLKDEFPGNFNLDYRIGCCYLNIPYELQKSVPYLETAVKHISIIHKETNLKETLAPIDAWFYLGDAYRVNNQLEKAIQSYKQFKQLTTDKEYDFTLVNDQIKACEYAMVMKKHPVDEVETNLGDVINTRFSETNPVVSEDETMLVYAAWLPFYQAMLYSRKMDGKWSMPVNMLPELGVDGDCFPTSISPDGTELYIYRSDEFQGDLYVSNFQNGQWTKIRKLNSNINTRYWESHACISHDGKTLYFTSNRKGGYGALDIYKSTRPSVSSDDWGVPVNLGLVVNSSYNDDTPFITADDRRLYFSSFGHKTIGGYDIFYTDLTSDGSWTQPVNIGYPINTAFDELFFYPVKNGTFAYMAKFDPEGYGRHDIIRYEIFSDAHPRKSQTGVSLKSGEAGNEHVNLSVYNKTGKDTVSQEQGTPEDYKAKERSRAIEANNTKPSAIPSKTRDNVSQPVMPEAHSVVEKAEKPEASPVPFKNGWKLYAILSGGLVVLLFFIFIFVRRRKNNLN